MKISIVTVTYNSEATIEDTILSVINQKYKNYEHIIIDGCSKDKTLSIAKHYAEISPKIKVVSERDDGIYNAMNKGISLATGDIIALLNSDDFFLENALDIVLKAFSQSDAGIVACSIYKLDEENNKYLNVERDKPLSKRTATVNHPGVFVKKHIYENVGLFDEGYKISADYDFVCRCLNKNIKIAYLNEYTTVMRTGGVSDNFRFLLLKRLEHYNIVLANNDSKRVQFQLASKLVIKTLTNILFELLVTLNLRKVENSHWKKLALESNGKKIFWFRL